MNRNSRQMVCTLLAVTAPLAHCAGVGYVAVLLAAGAMLPLTVVSRDGLKRISKPEALVELVWLGLVLGMLMKNSGANWPGSRSELVVPLTILLLAAISGESERSARCCATVFWIGVIPGILVTAALVGRMELTWLTPERKNWTGSLIAVLLYPSINGTEKGNRLKTAALTAITAVGLALIIQGGLGIGPARGFQSPLYELGRCVGNGGFEIVISVVLTLSWYGFAAMGMRTAESFGRKLALSTGKSRISILAVAAMVIISGENLKEWIVISGCLILWILIPLLHQKNKSKKDEKRC